jgi:cation:H+ antiporter
LVWLKFLFCLVVILFAGTKLARYGDTIAKKTGLSGLWIGLVLLSAITSVPEIATGISSAALVGSADLSLGTLFGSNLFNLAILAFIDVCHPFTPVLSVVSTRHILLAFGAVLLTGVAAASILAGEALSGIALGWLGVPSIVILLLYLFFIRMMFRFEKNDRSSPASEIPTQHQDTSLGMVWLKFSLAAAAVIGAGIWISFIGDDIAQATGWGASFVGSLFLAISTSAPELVVTFAALRLGALDMAVADILGSNMFNMTIIFLADIFYTRQAILSSASKVHTILAAAGILISLLIIIALRFRQKRKCGRFFSWYSLPLIILYFLGFYMLFASGIS